MIYYVYTHCRIKDGNIFYVGKGHADRAFIKQGRSQHWKNIVAKDGGFHVSFIAKDLDEDFAFLLECEMIDRCKRLGIKLVNKTNGGDGISGYRHTPETKAKMAKSSSLRSKGNKHWLGRKHSEKTKQLMSKKAVRSEAHRKSISIAQKGKKLSNNTKQKISASKIGKPGGHLGFKHSDQAKEKMKAAWRKRENPELLLNLSI